jgi:hypothetical protein
MFHETVAVWDNIDSRKSYILTSATNLKDRG